MLTSFRLIVATFLCGFLAVFAGLRITAAVRANHDALPNLATRAIPSLAASARAADAPRFEVTVPVMFDIKAVANVTPVVPIPVRLSPSDDPLPESAALDQPAAAVEAKPEPPAPSLAPLPPDDPAVLAPLSILPDIPAPSDAVATPATPVEPAATTEISAPAPAAAAPPPVTSEAVTVVEAAVPLAPDKDAVDTASADPVATASVKPPAIKQPRAKSKTARAKRPRVARRTANDPFSFNFNQAPR
jgi:hypothetical protein